MVTRPAAESTGSTPGPADPALAAVIPAELRERRQWVVWKFDTGVDGRRTKVPYSTGGYRVSSKKPEHWKPFVSVYANRHGFEGVGFVLAEADPYVGVDLDGCINESGDLAEWAVEIVDKLAGVAYGEVSPSGTGIKFLTKAKKPTKKCTYKIPNATGKQQIECYERCRFWTITGSVYGDAFERIGDGQAAVDWLAEKYLKDTRRSTPPRTRRHAIADRSQVLKRASGYLATKEIAISGQGGSVACFNAALAMVKGFSLSEGEAFDLIANEYNPKCLPPWSDAELMHKIKSAAESDKPDGYLLDSENEAEASDGQAAASESANERFSFTAKNESGLTDLANAKRFVDRYHAEILHVPEWKKILAWDGQRWNDDCGVGARQRAHRYAESLWGILGKAGPVVDERRFSKMESFVRSTNQTAKIEAFLKLSQVDERIVCPVAELNTDPLALNVANGTIDLTTGKLRPHNPADRITQLANGVFDPDATCPKWLETLGVIFDGDASLVRYVQQILGYAISGDTGEHFLPIAWGNGFNGKSTVWSVIVELLGDYASLANESLLLGDSKNHPTEIAQLYQKRFIAISEPEHGAKLREARVKELTGDRRITARRMNEDFWSFERTHTFWISTNHKPRISGTDRGIWRRIKLIPFQVDLTEKVERIADFDKWLVKHEGPGILRWLVDGFLDYRQNGLVEPDSVRLATDEYRSGSDLIGQFLAEHCFTQETAESDMEIPPGGILACLAEELFRCFTDEFGGKWTQQSFGRAITARGYEKFRERSKSKKSCWRGLSLKSSPMSENDRVLAEIEHDSESAGDLDSIGHLNSVGVKNPLVNPQATERSCPKVSSGQNCRDLQLECIPVDAPETARSGWIRTTCQRCGRVFGSRPTG